MKLNIPIYFDEEVSVFAEKKSLLRRGLIDPQW